MKIHLSKSTSIFNLIRMPIRFHFCVQNPPKSIQKSIPRDIKKMIDFWIDFLSILVPFWRPNWEPRAAQNGPKTLPRRPQDATKTAQEQQEHTRSKFGRFLVPKPDGSPSPSLDFRGLWVHFGTTFGAKFALRNFEKHFIKF